MRRIQLVFGVAALLSVVGWARQAAAAPSPEMLELGKKEYEAGSRDFDLGHYEKALEHFEASYRLTGRAALLFNLGYVHEWLYGRNRRLEELEQAIERFKAYLIATANETDKSALDLRGRAEKDLRRCDLELAKERAQRARGEEALAVGEDALARGNLPEAIAQVDKYERASGNERPGLVRAYALRARIVAAAGDAAGAANWYQRALSLDSAVVLPPKPNEALRKAFAEAQHRMEGKSVEQVTHTPPGGLRPGQPVELAFNIASDPAFLIAGFQVYYRLAGGRAYAKIPVGAVGRVVLPRGFTQQLQAGTKIEYYADVLDRTGAFLEHLGTDGLPFTAIVGKPPGVNVAKRWWFWTALVAVAAGAAVGGGLGYYYTRPVPPPSFSINTGLTVHKTALTVQW